MVIDDVGRVAACRTRLKHWATVFCFISFVASSIPSSAGAKQNGLQGKIVHMTWPEALASVTNKYLHPQLVPVGGAHY